MVLLHIIENALIFEFILACSVACLKMLGADSLASLAIALNFCVVAAIFGMVVASSQRMKSKNFGMVLLILLLSFVGMFVTAENGISFDYIKKWLMFNSTVMLYYSVCELPVVTKKTLNFFWGAALVLSLFYFFMYATGRHYLYADGVTFNLGNPNFTGICVLCAFLAICSLYGFVRGNKKRLGLIIVLFILAYFIYLTRARASMISVFLFMLAVALYRGRYCQWVSWFTLLLPLIFAILYMSYIGNQEVQEELAFAESEGKSLTSRFAVWSGAFEIIRNNLLLGNYYAATDGTGQVNLHNTHLDIMATFGVPVLGLTLFLLASILKEIGNQITESYQLSAILGFYAIIINGTFEAAMFSASQGMFAMSVGLLLVAKYKEQYAVNDELLEFKRLNNFKKHFYKSSF